MNSKHYCATCGIDYLNAEKLRSHRTYMRIIGDVIGHEAKTSQSKKGSIATASIGGEKIGERMKDFQTPEK
jgi:hypothetical protein